MDSAPQDHTESIVILDALFEGASALACGFGLVTVRVVVGRSALAPCAR
jgi:hypothetical protein